MTASKWQMPARLKEAGLSEDQCRIAYGYWMLRVKFARQQRNAIAGLALLAANSLLMRVFTDPAPAAPSAFISLVDFLGAWVIPTGLVLCVVVLVMTETVVIFLNKKIANPAQNLKMTPHAVEVVRRMGNSVALHTMLFRKMPDNS